MKLRLLLALSACALACHAPGRHADAAPGLVHGVYFSLRDDSPGARAALVASCKKHLAPIEGIVYFAAGTRDEGLARDVNDRDFDVSLLVVFRDRAAHDRYQPDERHQRFIAENRDNWERVRVFDSLAEAP